MGSIGKDGNSEHSTRFRLQDFADYKQRYQESISDVDFFWAQTTRQFLTYEKDFTSIRQGKLAEGNLQWFANGRLNAAYNCVHRHAEQDPSRIAIIYEGDEPDCGHSISYGELSKQIFQAAAALRNLGVRKGDRVCVYMPMIPEAFVTVLAINHLGAIHSLVFDGFSAQALGDRIRDAGAFLVVTADKSRRGGRDIPMKQTVDEALGSCPDVRTVLVYQHGQDSVSWNPGRDVWWHEVIDNTAPLKDIAPESMASEDPLFILYTSGSTGKPKGLVHSTAGFLTGAAATGHHVFDMHPSDVFFTPSDIGWITGLVYALYAPLLLGCTTVIFEGSPLHPTVSRLWDICDLHSVTHFYAAPTVIRLLRRFSDAEIHQAMTSLRVLGSIGEPIAPDVWDWYHRIVGKEKADLLDTYFQTETGSFVLAPLARITPTKPGSCTLPCLGLDPVILDPITGKEVETACPEGILAFRQPWPSMARTAWNDHQRFMDTYLNVYPGYYFTGDGARQDEDGYFWIKGRVDDVVNVSGHRLSTAEIEAALLECEFTAEVAVVGVGDSLTGEALVAFAVLKSQPPDRDVRKDLKQQVLKSIGSLAVPRTVYLVQDIPKTRSGKITRRILRKILADDVGSIGDISTVANPAAIDSVAATVLGSK
ncbi:acetate--CoA ligase [Penicillium subrubescens]|uniref:Acetyl-coenzyme A synthetase n=1 Tax=Penicillium subrubescens TaxID=1316194 RepID=A0A1Q5UGJ0_9EURO|nr:acetate--CoA ligase [Penicillium subrubescens]KAJ5875445.1 acetate--CoA ligase [Penicillium subrubescens]OKP11610.1 Acetyl-coenzyme A synthetase [Penicillium subrubescens]